MIESPYIHALLTICIRLKNCKSSWVVTGSLGMALQGMDIEVHDIDIQTDESGAYEIESRLVEFVVEPVHFWASERICSHHGILKIDGIKVEIMGDLQKLLANQVWEEPVQVEPHRHWLCLEGMQVPVLSLEYECQAYQNLGRLEKAERIRNWLKQSRLQNEKAG